MGTFEPSIILGNGFNLALKECSSINIQFGYKDILNEVKIKSKESSHELSVFLEQNGVNEDLKTDDIEVLLAILKNSSQCLTFCSKNYCDCKPNYENKIKQNFDLLKKIVIEVMTDKKLHPEYLEIFNEENNCILNRCKRNLECFNRIFTINYDLILYWLLNNRELLWEYDKSGKLVKGKFRDGFSSKEEYKPIDFNNHPIDSLYGYAGTNNRPNLFWLHGALHLLHDKAKAYKVVRKNKDLYLDLFQLRNLLLKDYSTFENLLVFDATSYDKIRNIYANAYLEKGYDKIITTPGDIIIYGCNLLNNTNDSIDLGNDIHLWRRVINSRAKKIYLGIGAEDSSELNSFAEQAAKEFKTLRCIEDSDIRIYTYSHKLFNIWKTENFYKSIQSNSSEGYSAAINLSH
ncbi:DUF4917 family protein [Legionella saoudiensis]|uniref:DUF4917 family protein n=1 Tax=Legionella saoudiensis TaxID=1750561 RepID=UPI00073035B1|nr:DUF4917 family protein [Legionella saoudiensis]